MTLTAPLTPLKETVTQVWIWHQAQLVFIVRMCVCAGMHACVCVCVHIYKECIYSHGAALIAYGEFEGGHTHTL